ncbi:ECF transporter S component [Clostridium sp. CCUG 7971]|uniref:ECF transporter S component n=1 Tax=Clostridium sp. CCUG 7971 TaxID=2811414 RepID=UPI001ABA6C5D|nr:ECF transporter S component [Clostridium sp. CCUG 7971]MBO3445105.1 ECF transporter S component [Clostridium sp. CCUG 7971]
MKSKKIVLSGIFIALGIILPMIFHTVNMAGPIFLPMNIPVLIGGFLLGPIYGGLVGLITPILSGLMTGMPPIVPMMPIMAFELCAYGIITGFLFNKTKNTYISLIGAMIGGRLFAMVGAFLVSITIAPQVNPVIFIFGNLAQAIPGMLIQIVFIPILVKFMTKNPEISKVLT